MALIQPDVSQAVPDGAYWVAKLEDILEQRRSGAITRGAFLHQWALARQKLAQTTAYRVFRHTVRNRANGQCQECGGRGSLPHHKAHVAYAPSRALDPENAEWLCDHCHRTKRHG